MPKVSVSDLRRVLHYDPSTGVFTRKVKAGGLNVGDVVGSDHGDGYLKIQVLMSRRYAHYWAWMYVYGEEPPGFIDHINGDRSDNRIENLRLCTRLENNRNRKLRKDSTTGLKGVSFHKQSGKFRARISYGGKERCLGLHATPEEAYVVYMEKAIEVFGDFARFE